MSRVTLQKKEQDSTFKQLQKLMPNNAIKIQDFNNKTDVNNYKKTVLNQLKPDTLQDNCNQNDTTRSSRETSNKNNITSKQEKKESKKDEIVASVNTPKNNSISTSMYTHCITWNNRCECLMQ